jgi:hypothetical protein
MQSVLSDLGVENDIYISKINKEGPESFRLMKPSSSSADRVILFKDCKP